MATKNQSYTMDKEVLFKLTAYANAECISKSRAVNRILSKFLNLKIIDEIEKKKSKPQTEEDRLKDWEWRKKMVTEGKFSVRMGEEYPRMDNPDIEEIYLTPDGLPSDIVK